MLSWTERSMASPHVPEAAMLPSPAASLLRAVLLAWLLNVVGRDKLPAWVGIGTPCGEEQQLVVGSWQSLARSRLISLEDYVNHAVAGSPQTTALKGTSTARQPPAIANML